VPDMSSQRTPHAPSSSAPTKRAYSTGNVAKRLRRTFVRTGAVWLYGAAVCLGIAAFSPWISAPLIDSWQSWQLPIDMGWSLSAPVVSYGLLTLSVAAYLFWRAALATDWTALAPRGVRRVAPLSLPTAARLSALAAAPVLLFLFQYLFVDMALSRTLLNDENQSLLLRAHLGYGLPDQRFALSPFEMSINSVGQRFYLLALLGSGGLFALIGAVVCCGLGLMVRPIVRRMDTTGNAKDEHDHEAAPQQHERHERHGLQWRWLLVIGGALFAIIVFGRAPAGFVAKDFGLAALNAGAYRTALDDFSLATWLAPNLNDLPSFQQERGEALYSLGKTNTIDAQMYLAAQYMTVGANDRAWAVERSALQTFPPNDGVKDEASQTLEILVEENDAIAYLPTDDSTEATTPQLASEVAQADQSLPWLGYLLAIQPDNVYALYMHGRILFSARLFAPAASDFLALAQESHDTDMLSAAYTYLALSYGGEGNLVAEREYLQIATELDHNYDNTTAREAQSGLH